jgi:hypothetical protein
MSPAALIERHFDSHFYSGVLGSFYGATGRVLRKNNRIAVIWLLVDHIMLLFQSAVYVNIWRGRAGDRRLIYSSLSLQDRAFLDFHELASDTRDSDIDMIESSGIGLAASIRDLRPGRSPEDALFPDFLDKHSARLIVQDLLEYADSLIRDIEFEPEDLEVGHASTSPVQKFDAESVKILDLAIGSVIDTVGRCRLTKPVSGDGVNLFAVVRHPSGTRLVEVPEQRRSGASAIAKYPYSPRLVPSAEQCERLQGAGGDPDQLRLPLSDGQRSIADTPLMQGAVDFGFSRERFDNKWDRQYYGESPAGKDRKELESLFLRTELGIPRSGSDEAENIFYVPVHLGGFPWIAIFTFHRGRRSKDSMMRNLFFYRDLLPPLAETLSLSVQAAFATHLISEGARSYAVNLGKPAFIGDTNEKWKGVCALYPYQSIQLTRSETAFRVETEAQQALWLHIDEGYRFLEFRTLDAKMLGVRVGRALDVARLQQEHVYDRVHGDTLFVLSHQIGKLFQESGIVGLRTTSGDLAQRAIKNRVLLAWGMAEACTPLKSGSFPERWFKGKPRTDPDRDLERTLLSVVQFYLGAVSANLNPRIAIGIAAWNQPYRRYGADEVREWLTIDPVSLSPFGRDEGGKRGTLAVTIGLAELLRNAAHYIVQSHRWLLDESQMGTREPECLRVRLMPSSDDLATISIVVENVTLGVERLNSGTLAKIREVENHVLVSDGHAVVQTSPPEFISDEEQGKFAWLQGKWTYHYRRLEESTAQWRRRPPDDDFER